MRRILVQKMRLLAGRSAERDPSDEELRELQARHVGEYLPPAHVSFWHVFVAWSRGKDVEVDVGEAATTREAEVLLSTLRSKDVAPTDATHLGDSFFLSSPRVSQPLPQVERLFGVEFADDLLDAATGRWIGPLRSPYGLHLVRIESREPGEPPTFEALRGQLAERWRDEQRREGISRLTRELARRHPLEIESAAWRSRHEG